MRNAYASRLSTRNVLTMDDLRAVAPSIFAESPSDKVSERYVFVPTSQVVERIMSANYSPVQAGQSNARAADGRLHTKHIIRFRHNALIDANGTDMTPEILLVNSHDRSAAFSLNAGIFRFVCSNGLVVKSADFGKFSFRHSGDAADRIAASTNDVAEIAQRAIDRARDMSKIVVTPTQQRAFAKEAAKLRFKDAEDFNLINGLLVPRRAEEAVDGAINLPKADLFTTVNVVQENLMRGKIQRTLGSGRKSSTHAVNSVHADLTINKGVWALAEKFVAEVAGA